MRYLLRIHARVEDDLAHLHSDIQRRLLAAIHTLSENPRPAGAVRLSAEPATYRIRVGDYRIIYAIIEQQLVVLIIAAGHRSDIYKRLRRLNIRQITGSE